MGADFADLAPSEEWRRALEAVPRELFVPDVAWSTQDGLIDRRADPDTWQVAVERNDAVVTQIDDGNTELTADSPWKTLEWTSSCSAPGAVFEFLRLLDPYEGDRVLEIGTGTGWTAALLSARLGAERVASVEVDEEVAKQAAANLERAGFSPTLVVGDGARGWPEGAPFDRVHVTCGVRDIPYSWVAQTRPGGIIALPWIPDEERWGYKARLAVTEGRAVGRFVGGSGYMMLRSQRRTRPPIHGEVRVGGSRIDPRRINNAGNGFGLVLAALMPRVAVGQGLTHRGDGTLRWSLRDEVSDSHAIAIQPPQGGRADVKQRGPRNLWQELEAAFLAWLRLGEPEAERFGLSVDAEGQHVWLDYVDNTIEEAR